MIKIRNNDKNSKHILSDLKLCLLWFWFFEFCCSRYEFSRRFRRRRVRFGEKKLQKVLLSSIIMIIMIKNIRKSIKMTERCGDGDCGDGGDCVGGDG